MSALIYTEEKGNIKIKAIHIVNFTKLETNKEDRIVEKAKQGCPSSK